MAALAYSSGIVYRVCLLKHLVQLQTFGWIHCKGPSGFFSRNKLMRGGSLAQNMNSGGHFSVVKKYAHGSPSTAAQAAGQVRRRTQQLRRHMNGGAVGEPTPSNCKPTTSSTTVTFQSGSGLPPGPQSPGHNAVALGSTMAATKVLSCQTRGSTNKTTGGARRRRTRRRRGRRTSQVGVRRRSNKRRYSRHRYSQRRRRRRYGGRKTRWGCLS